MISDLERGISNIQELAKAMGDNSSKWTSAVLDACYEKQEREKGCEACRSIGGQWDDMRCAEDADGNTIYLLLCSSESDVEMGITFCPYCGRDLREGCCNKEDAE